MENPLNMDLEVRDRSQIERMGRIWCIIAALKGGDRMARKQLGAESGTETVALVPQLQGAEF